MKRAGAALLLALSAGCAAHVPLPTPSPSTPYGLFALDEEGGLLGVKLGASVEALAAPRALGPTHGETLFFEDETLPRALGSAPLGQVAVAVHRGVIVALVLEVEAEARPALLHELQARYGGPSAVEPARLGWIGGRVQLLWEDGEDGALIFVVDEELLRARGAKLPRPTI